MTSRAITSSAYGGHDDLRAMESIVSAAWLGPDRPNVSCTVGDLEWWQALAGPGVDWAERVRIWWIGGDPVGWAWFAPPSSIDWFVRHDLDSASADTVRDEIDEWQLDRTRTWPATTDAMAPGATATAGAPAPTASVSGAAVEAPMTVEQWAAEGSAAAARLARRGWTASDAMLTQYGQPLDIELDPPRVPDGYVLRSLRGPDDIPARVEVHRAAFAPSRLTVEKYAILVGQDHYAVGRDIVLEATDGTFAAFAMCWADPVGSIGEFEPVGTHPDHQRRGLGRVIMRHGLRLMRAAGLRDALVFSFRSNVASEALYRSAGFAEIAIHRRWTRPLEP